MKNETGSKEAAYMTNLGGSSEGYLYIQAGIKEDILCLLGMGTASREGRMK
jgi:hypothetical protein